MAEKSTAESPPGHAVIRWVFLRVLGATALVATLSLAVQADGLIGEEGILPAEMHLDEVRRFGEEQGWGVLDQVRRVPTLGWFVPHGLEVSASLGVAGLGSALLLVNLMPFAGLLLAFVGYLSLQTMGGIFTGYQWDILLIEALFLALFLVPLGWRPGLALGQKVPLSGLFVNRLLLFKVMFLSGIVKLTSGDPNWADLSALTYHYWSQPLPNGLSWHVHHLPEWFHTISAAGMFFIELVVPFALFAGRRARLAAFCLFSGLLGFMGLTGSYGFFHLLTFALCLLALDDPMLRRWMPGKLKRLVPEASAERRPRVIGEVIAWVLVGALSLVSVAQMTLRIDREAPVPDPLRATSEWLAPFQVVNNYGLFATMTTTRPEVVIEGSVDGQSWRTLHFPFKPTRLSDAPRSAGLHMPRVDWQLWFAGLRGHCRNTRWYLPFVKKLLEGSPAVHGLLSENPFPEGPPARIRSTLYEYRFAPPEARAEKGEWWTRARIRPFCPTLVLEKGQLLAVPDLR
jgi:hypothetical protein